jgi:aminopeptidase N
MHRIFFKKGRAILYLILFLICSLNAQSQSKFVLDIKTRNYDQKNVKLFLSFGFHKEEVIGKEEFTFAPLIDNFDQLILHCKTTKVSSVKYGNENLKFSQDSDLLYINFQEELNKNKNVTITIEYTSLPSSGLFFFYPAKENPKIPYQIWSQGEGTENRYWYPAYDEPDDKLSSEIIATVPDSLIAISNGDLISVTQNASVKTKTFDWKMDQVHANYLTTLIVGDFVTVKEKLRGTILEYNLPREWKDKYNYFYGRTPQMLNFYSNYIYPYPYSRYAQTTVQDFLYGGMENVTATTLNRRLMHDQRAVPNYSADGLIAHEFAHQWFGDFLTCKTWKHVWLNEGFATYLTDLWTENEYGKNEFRYLRYNENMAYFNEVKDDPLKNIKRDSTGVVPAEMGGGKAYDRGAAVLNVLRFYLGDKAFEKGIHHYVSEFKDSAVVTEDFRKAMEESSGKDLKEFFNQWIYGAGFPVYNVSYKWDENTKKLTLNVKQVQEQLPAVGLFTAPVLIEIVAGKLDIEEELLISKKENSFTFNCNEKPQLVRFNKYFRTLCVVHFNKDFDELIYQLQYDDDVTGRMVAAQAMAEFGEKAVPYLERTIRRDNFYGVRITAVQSLRKIGGDIVYKPLLEAAEDPDARVREEAVKSLSIFHNDENGKFLAYKFNTETNDYVKGAAAFSIITIRMKDAFKFAEKALTLDSHRNIIRRYIFEGLNNLKDPRSIKLTKEYTKYKYSYGGMHLLDIVALDCAMNFAKTHRKEVIDAVSEALGNPYFRTRNHAADLLVKLDAKEKLPLLKEIEKNERRQVVLRTLDAAITKLETK